MLPFNPRTLTSHVYGSLISYLLSVKILGYRQQKPTLANLFSKVIIILPQKPKGKARKPGLDKCQTPREDMQ